MRERTLNALPLIGYAVAALIGVLYLTGFVTGIAAGYLFFTGAVIAIASERLDKHQGDKNTAAYLAARTSARAAHPSNQAPTTREAEPA